MTRSRPERQKQSTVLLPDPIILVIVLLLLLVGVLFVYEASVVEAHTLFNDKLHFARLQFSWAIIGLVLATVTAFLPPRIIKQLSFPFFIATLFLLLLVLIPGIGVSIQGARRWLSVGSFSFQPSELVKISAILYFSALFQKKTNTKQFLAIVGVMLLLVLLQPDMGTTIILAASSFVIFYLAGAPLIHYLSVIVAAIAAGSIMILTSDYRRARLLTFLDPNRDPLGSSYHIRQILIALGSGGLLGTGIGRSLQKYQFLPEPTTDSIFAVIGEEIGFIGAGLIILLYLAFATRGIYLSSLSQDPFHRIVIAGISLTFTLQALLNLAAMVALVPLTGITLPLISYGRSSLITSLIAIGILLNFSRFRTKNV